MGSQYPPPEAGQWASPYGYPSNAPANNDTVVNMGQWGQQPEIQKPQKPPQQVQMTDYGEYSRPSGYPGHAGAGAAYQQPHAYGQSAPPHRPQALHGDAAAAQAVAQEAQDRWNKEVRKAFLWKVLLLVAIQLAVTCGAICVFLFVDKVQDYVIRNVWVLWASWGLGLALILVLACAGDVRRRHPWNYILWAAFTLTMSVMVASITAYYSQRTVLLAFSVTAATVLGAFCVAAFTPLDLTKAGGFLIALLFGLIVMMFFGIFWPNKWYYFVISILVAALFTAFLIHDLQLVMGGKKFELGPDEYILASISIYLDIINIFLALLRVIGIASG